MRTSAAVSAIVSSSSPSLFPLPAEKCGALNVPHILLLLELLPVAAVLHLAVLFYVRVPALPPLPEKGEADVVVSFAAPAEGQVVGTPAKNSPHKATKNSSASEETAPENTPQRTAAAKFEVEARPEPKKIPAPPENKDSGHLVYQNTPDEENPPKDTENVSDRNSRARDESSTKAPLGAPTMRGEAEEIRNKGRLGHPSLAPKTTRWRGATSGGGPPGTPPVARKVEGRPADTTGHNADTQKPQPATPNDGALVRPRLGVSPDGGERTVVRPGTGSPLVKKAPGAPPSAFQLARGIPNGEPQTANGRAGATIAGKRPGPRPTVEGDPALKELKRKLEALAAGPRGTPSATRKATPAPSSGKAAAPAATNGKGGGRDSRSGPPQPGNPEAVDDLETKNEHSTVGVSGPPGFNAKKTPEAVYWKGLLRRIGTTLNADFAASPRAGSRIYFGKTTLRITISTAGRLLEARELPGARSPGLELEAVAATVRALRASTPYKPFPKELADRKTLSLAVTFNFR